MVVFTKTNFFNGEILEFSPSTGVVMALNRTRSVWHKPEIFEKHSESSPDIPFSRAGEHLSIGWRIRVDYLHVTVVYPEHGVYQYKLALCTDPLVNTML